MQHFKKDWKWIKGSYFPHRFIGLAIFDNLCLTSTFFNDGLHYWFVGTVIPMDNAYAVYWPITWPIYMFAFTGNASMTLLVCVERFIFVVYPFKSKIWCSKKRTLLYICVATVICCILTMPHFFAFTWDKNGKVKQTDLLLKYGQIDGLSIPDELIRLILPPVILITLSTIVAIKVSSICDIRQRGLNSLVLSVLDYLNAKCNFILSVQCNIPNICLTTLKNW